MAFIKNGDPQPIVVIKEEGEELINEETKLALEEAMQGVKNIDRNSNKMEFTKKSSE
jgi:hypothetical protein